MMRVLLLVAFASFAIVSADQSSWTATLSKLSGTTPAPTAHTLAPAGAFHESGATYWGDDRLTGTVTEHCHCVGCEGPPDGVHFQPTDVGKTVVVTGDDVTVDGKFRQVHWGNKQHHNVNAKITHVSLGLNGMVQLEGGDKFPNPPSVTHHVLSPANSPEACALACEEDVKCTTSMWKEDAINVRCFKYYHKVESVECTGAKIFTCYQKATTCAAVSSSTADAGYADNYRGWYDVQRCGKCNDYCRWVGNNGSGGDPATKQVHGTSYWSCRLAGGSAPFTAAGHYLHANSPTLNNHTTSTSLFPYKKCTSQGDDIPRESCRTVHTAPPRAAPTTAEPGSYTWPPGIPTVPPRQPNITVVPTEVPTVPPALSSTQPTEVPSTATPSCDDSCNMIDQHDYHGNDLIKGGHTDVADHQECCQLCHANAACTFWTYSTGNSNGKAAKLCWLKDSNSGAESQIERQSGGSGCWLHANGTSTSK